MGVLLVLLGLAVADGVRAQLRVRVPPDGCPTAAELERQLAPLLPEGGEPIVAVPQGEARAVVDDQGARYTVEVDGVVRQLEDAARACVERARVAAVFIALNLEPRAAASPPQDQEPPPPPPPLVDPGPAFGLAVLGAFAHAPDAEVSAPAAAAGVWLASGSLRFGVELGARLPVALDLRPADGVEGSVEQTRFLLELHAAYLFGARPLELGPYVGVGGELQRLRGMEVVRPQEALRFNPTAALGLHAQLRLSERLQLLARASGRAVPRAHDLTIEPLGRLGRTPRAWLALELGLALELP